MNHHTPQIEAVEADEIEQPDYRPGELIEKDGKLCCWQCGEPGSLLSGYCLVLPDGETMCRGNY